VGFKLILLRSEAMKTGFLFFCLLGATASQELRRTHERGMAKPAEVPEPNNCSHDHHCPEGWACVRVAYFKMSCVPIVEGIGQIKPSASVISTSVSRGVPVVGGFGSLPVVGGPKVPYDITSLLSRWDVPEVASTRSALPYGPMLPYGPAFTPPPVVAPPKPADEMTEEDKNAQVAVSTVGSLQGFTTGATVAWNTPNMLGYGGLSTSSTAFGSFPSLYAPTSPLYPTTAVSTPVYSPLSSTSSFPLASTPSFPLTSSSSFPRFSSIPGVFGFGR